MNLKTTIALILATGLGLGGGVWLTLRNKPSESASSPTLDFLHKDLTADKITRIEVTRWQKPPEPHFAHASTIGLLGQDLFAAAAMLYPRVPATLVILEKKKGDPDWHLPGGWQVRSREVDDWLKVLTSLRSRFAPIPLDADAKLSPYGLDEDPLTIKVKLGDSERVLRFGEEPDAGNRFTRSTFVRLDSEKEVIQLGPGIVSALERNAEYFRLRRLFPAERVPKDEDSLERVEQLDARSVEVQTKDAKFTLVKKDKDWVLKEAFKKKDKDWLHVASEDRLDPARRDAFLRGLPDLWAEKFIESKSFAESGLKDPDITLTVTTPAGRAITVLVGNVSDKKTRFEMKQGPPGMPPQPSMISEESRFAMLKDGDQIFEIRGAKLADIALPLERLRDPMLARFKAADVKRVEIRFKEQDIVLAKIKDKKDKDKEKWIIERPSKEDADEKAVDDLIEKLAGVKADEDTLQDESDPAKFGLDKPIGSIKVALEEVDKELKQKSDKKEEWTRPRTIVYQLGAAKKDDEKLFVRVEGWRRIMELRADVRKIVSQSDLVYRPRELWRVDRDDIKRITIEADGTPYHLDRSDKGWKLGAPINAEIAGKEIETLAGELAHVTAERFEAGESKDLARFGLDKPPFKIDVQTKDGKSHSLEIGNRVKEPEGGRYARLKDGKAIVVISDKLAAPLRKDPLELIDRGLWSLKMEDVQRIRWQGSASFALEQKKGPWFVVDAPMPSFSVDDLAIKSTLAPLVQLRADKYVAFGDKLDLPKYGLDNPVTTITVTIKDGDKTTDRVLLLGKEAPGGGRYAQVKSQNGVVVLDADFVEDVQVTHLDFVDRRVLKFDGDTVMTIERKMKGNHVELTRREDNWLITKPGTRDADLLTMADVLRKTSMLQARRIVASNTKELAKFGLDNPTAVVTLHLEAADGSVGKHVIKVGNLAKDMVKKDTDERYALIDDRPLVVVLPADLSRHLTAPALYFADRNLASFASVDWIELKRGPRAAIFTRVDGTWKLKQPIEAVAEPKVIDEMIQSLQRLRADEIVAIADKGTDLKKYGLDKPHLQWRFKTGETEQLNLVIGGLEKDEPGARRYARLDGKAAIFLLSNRVIARLEAEGRDRAVGKPFDAKAVDKLTVTGDGKTFALARKDTAFVATDEPAAKVNQVDVNNTLGILGSLKAIRFAADAKAVLKDFGLEKPAWKLEVELGKEKRELWLGDFEEKSKRRYATVAGSGAVFVIDEIDSLILARPRSAYVEEPKKIEEKKGPPRKKVLLLWQMPDGHPKDTHEYELGQKILKRELDKFAELDVVLVNADEPWKDGPELLAKADGVVLFISEGAKWLSADAKRLEAFRAYAKRKAGLAVLHWGMGTKEAKNIDAFVELFGGCHGGPDRKYQVLATEAIVMAEKRHPIQLGLSSFKVRDEFYYNLKFPKNGVGWPVLHAKIDGQDHVVAWAHTRADEGRSFGFSGLHFHENWQMPEYRRLVTQGVLWTLNIAIPKDGIKVN